jgi:CheY-like chemotaxis protein
MNSAIRSILLVDDDQDDQYFFATALGEIDRDIQLITAGNGLEALEKLKTASPDLILLDLVMPKMNGLGFMKEVRKSRRLSNIPVMIYTADLGIFDEHELLRLGAEQVCIKPVDFDSTVRKIRDILRTNVYLKSA